MPFNHFISQANIFGKQRCPFFFLIDFEQRKPLIFPLSETANQGIRFDIRGLTNSVEKENRQPPEFSLAVSPIEFECYKQGFDLVRREIQKGNSYLLNLTYPTLIATNYNLAEIFQYSRAPYKLLFDKRFVCFSPECFVRIERNRIFTYPMKGTVKASEPNAEKRLLNDDKERREHYTIVDLMRNDLAMVAERIEVQRFRYVEKVGNGDRAVLQTSSEICGRLSKNWQARIGSILAALLPAGSISGAPKERTVEIIRCAEGNERGYYTGIFGIFNGDSLDSAVAIRFIERQGNRLYFRSGGGITRHSIAENEYAELIAKVSIPLKEEIDGVSTD